MISDRLGKATHCVNVIDWHRHPPEILDHLNIRLAWSLCD